MILLDTHVWVWWSIDSERLSAGHRRLIDEGEQDGIGVSVFSFWEVAMLAARNRVDLGGGTVEQWFARVSAIPTLHVLPLTPQIALDSTTLPGAFHADPADRIIVATARAYAMPLLTEDRQILGYPHVRSIGPN